MEPSFLRCITADRWEILGYLWAARDKYRHGCFEKEKKAICETNSEEHMLEPNDLYSEKGLLPGLFLLTQMQRKFKGEKVR